MIFHNERPETPLGHFIAGAVVGLAVGLLGMGLAIASCHHGAKVRASGALQGALSALVDCASGVAEERAAETARQRHLRAAPAKPTRLPMEPLL